MEDAARGPRFRGDDVAIRLPFGSVIPAKAGIPCRAPHPQAKDHFVFIALCGQNLPNFGGLALNIGNLWVIRLTVLRNITKAIEDFRRKHAFT